VAGAGKTACNQHRTYYVIDGAGAAEFLQRLHTERQQSKNPFFCHAAYRAIDNILIPLEVYVDWTIARLNEHWGQ
jgi:hypothetical protein